MNNPNEFAHGCIASFVMFSVIWKNASSALHRKMFSMFSWNVFLNDREVSEKPDEMLDINRTANSFVSR